MKRSLIVMLSILLFNSCELNLEDSPEYYQFTESNYRFIPTGYNDVGKIIKFENQLNEEVNIEISAFTPNKKSNGGWDWSGGGTSTSLYYTEQILISFNLLDVNFPNIGEGYCNQLYISVEKKPNQELGVNFKIPAYTTFCSSSNLMISSPFNDLSTMTIGSVTYNKVKTFTTDTNYLFLNESTINKLYYDMKKGLIGFDDTLNNTQYRIVDE